MHQHNTYYNRKWVFISAHAKSRREKKYFLPSKMILSELTMLKKKHSPYFSF